MTTTMTTTRPGSIGSAWPRPIAQRPCPPQGVVPSSRSMKTSRSWPPTTRPASRTTGSIRRQCSGCWMRQGCRNNHKNPPSRRCRCRCRWPTTRESFPTPRKSRNRPANSWRPIGKCTKTRWKTKTKTKTTSERHFPDRNRSWSRRDTNRSHQKPVRSHSVPQRESRLRTQKSAKIPERVRPIPSPGRNSLRRNRLPRTTRDIPRMVQTRRDPSCLPPPRRETTTFSTPTNRAHTNRRKHSRWQAPPPNILVWTHRSSPAIRSAAMTCWRVRGPLPISPDLPGPTAQPGRPAAGS
mmetsp:Transcript_19818/g.55224  ORF Transcript_19818/g.55224 Transcript_19818/m.55224 type:complete len:295 (+) Transcript_19818:169-1053(+)